mmetsp:Transcript_8282/g.17260  ORF Transcript_8282/g.17260 Transcript_8282/m.17260 type:complete len:218 (-) Transcript_8282:314-967(-)|eukprot:CAMPEP_0172469728 /NCGR_PEP_ID=MMETSP1065-20121228/64501_1 /TAXON_ID=265537 /ORGANISM="Amphiprora paludosa, Strain CCMP125" /LENGTH=217 /DNA_ID=CAMNT_0013227471 /DNA_START=215 /DNA_END=868 /DNA_ORIENTATION=+
MASICAELAPWAGIIVFLAPIPTIQKIAQDKNVGNLPLLPYTSMIGSTFLWTTYGFLKSESKIWSTNLAGLVLGLFYFFNFVRHAPKASPTLPGSVNRHMQFILGMVVATSLIATMSPTEQLAISIIGSGGVCLAVALFASPLAVLRLVLEKKSAKSIPLPFTLASFANCVLWAITGVFVMDDMNVIIPNVLGLLCSIVQIALKLYYGDGSQLELPK